MLVERSRRIPTKQSLRPFSIELKLDLLWVSLDGASAECYADVRLGMDFLLSPHGFPKGIFGIGVSKNRITDHALFTVPGVFLNGGIHVRQPASKA